MAKAAPESALTLVALKVVLAALEACPLESPESARRLVAQVCDANPDHYTCREPADPPATFWRNPAQLIFSDSDVTNPTAGGLAVENLDSLGSFMFGFVAVKLEGVSVAWEAIAALRPEIGPPPASATVRQAIAGLIQIARRPRRKSQKREMFDAIIARAFSRGVPEDTSTAAVVERVAAFWSDECKARGLKRSNAPDWKTVNHWLGRGPL